MASCVITVHLIAALRRTIDYQAGDRSLLMGEVRDEIRHQHVEDAYMSLGKSQAAASTEDARQMGQIMRTGLCLSVLSSTVNWME